MSDGPDERKQKPHESQSPLFSLSHKMRSALGGMTGGEPEALWRKGGGRGGRGVSARSNTTNVEKNTVPPSTSLSPVAQRRRDLQLALLADARADEALVPALDDLAVEERRERRGWSKQHRGIGAPSRFLPLPLFDTHPAPSVNSNGVPRSRLESNLVPSLRVPV